ncbi:MAG TPA: chemotaxis response regulator protein-glutamate methylesterase [Candidatus Acidoferrum sp.]|nr:chemotaxis response regulator protein-glutamate methylesterase [Candidatus Acidoferrum sp.]
MSERIRVLVIDDSASMREVLSRVIARDPEFEVVGTAPDPVIAWERIKSLRPDVLSLDVEMPRMDGLSFLERLMTHFPIPVVMVSSLTERGCASTLRALELGAVDFVTKPGVDMVRGLEAMADELQAKLKIAARARVQPRRAAAPSAAPAPRALVQGTHKVIAIGSSTGGTEALRDVLTGLPADSPGVVIVQHMPQAFTRAFAGRLDGLCQIRVTEAEDGDRVLPGHALIAPGGRHLKVRRDGATYSVQVFDGSPVNRHRPSVDVLFHSCAIHLGGNAIGVILTGMGSDGARGLLEMRQAGAHTIAQDEASCVVFGMPREAIERGAAVDVMSLQDIASALRGGRRPRPSRAGSL